MRSSRSLCTVVSEVIASMGSHRSLDRLFLSAGAPGSPPDVAHHSKWKEWLFRAGQDSEVDSLAVLGGVLEEFMDLPPNDAERLADWQTQRARIEAALEENGLRYYRFGRVLPQGASPQVASAGTVPTTPAKPRAVEELLEVLCSRAPAGHAPADPPPERDPAPDVRK